MIRQKKRSQKSQSVLCAPAGNSKERTLHGPVWGSAQCVMCALSASTSLTRVQPRVVRVPRERRRPRSWKDLRRAARSVRVSQVSSLSGCSIKSFVTFAPQASSKQATIEFQSAPYARQASTTRTWRADLVLRAKRGAIRKQAQRRSASNALRER